jgi:flagellar hook-associated protein 3 FlgL
MTNLTRVTQGTLSRFTIDGLQANLGKLQSIQQKLSTGKEINRPSDGPSDAVSALHYRADIRRTDQYSRNADDGKAWLGMADSTLTGMLDEVRRARDLTLQGTNASMSVEERSAMAAEVDTIRDGLIGQSNTDYLGHPIFAGTYSNPTGATVAYDSNGVFQGDNGTVYRTIGKSTQVAVNVNGPAVFGSGATSLFSVLSQISADLRSTNPSDTTNLTQVDLGNLDTAVNNIQNTLADVGARYSRLDNIKTQNDTRMDDLKSSLSGVEDIDLPKTITDLQLQQVSYQTALAASAKMIQPSLVDFLR